MCRHKIRLAILPLLCGAALLACSPSIPPNTPPIRLSQISEDRPPQFPLLIEFLPGDRLPLTTTVQGDLLESLPASPTVVVVKRRFYVLFSKNDEPRISFDGRTIAQVPGAISIGLAVKKEAGASASFGLVLREKK